MSELVPNQPPLLGLVPLVPWHLVPGLLYILFCVSTHSYQLERHTQPRPYPPVYLLVPESDIDVPGS